MLFVRRRDLRLSKYVSLLWLRRAIQGVSHSIISTISRRNSCNCMASKSIQSSVRISSSRLVCTLCTRFLVCAGVEADPQIAVRTDTFIQKTKKLYMDTRANRNHLKMMSEDLRDIQGIMTKNIQEVLGRGEKLESNFSRTSMRLLFVLISKHACCDIHYPRFVYTGS